MAISKFLMVGLFLILLLGSSVAGYSCVYQTDNPQVQEFKMKLNNLAIQNDLKQGLTEEAIFYKIKYFNPCKKW